MNFPPHLPPDSCSIRSHYRRELLPFLFAALMVSLFAGLAAALAVVAWIVPPAPIDISVRSREAARLVNEESIDAGLAREIRQRLTIVHERGENSKLVFYTDRSRVGVAVILSSDGWAAVALPPYFAGRERLWEAVDAQGVRYSVERALPDVAAGVLYLKLAGSGFRIVSLPTERSKRIEAAVWAYDGDRFARAVVGQSISSVSELRVYSFARPQFRESVSPRLAAGSILFFDNGEFAGFVAPDGSRISPEAIALQIPRVLSGSVPAYRTVGIEGFMVRGVGDDRVVRQIDGFAVTKTDTRLAPEVRRGDVITRVNGELYDPIISAFAFLISSKETTFTLLRGGKEVSAQVASLEKR